MSKTIKIKFEGKAHMPTRAYPTDAGLDLRAIEGQVVPARGSAVFETGVHVQLLKNTAGILVSKSGLNVNHNITSTGLIDEGYTGAIKVKLYNHSDVDYTVNPGDKISQLVVVPVIYDYCQVLYLDDEVTEVAWGRGAKGFGSSGK